MSDIGFRLLVMSKIMESLQCLLHSLQDGCLANVQMAQEAMIRHAFVKTRERHHR